MGRHRRVLVSPPLAFRVDPDAFLRGEPHGPDMEYQPGVCNIGPTQQRRRLFLGIGSALLAVVHVAAVLAIGWPRWTLVLSMFPLYGAAMGVFDVGEGTTQVTDEAALAADRKRTVRLNTKSLAVGAVGALAIYGVALVGS